MRVERSRVLQLWPRILSALYHSSPLAIVGIVVAAPRREVAVEVLFGMVDDAPRGEHELVSALARQIPLVLQPVKPERLAVPHEVGLVSHRERYRWRTVHRLTAEHRHE